MFPSKGLGKRYRASTRTMSTFPTEMNQESVSSALGLHTGQSEKTVSEGFPPISGGTSQEQCKQGNSRNPHIEYIGINV